MVLVAPMNRLSTVLALNVLLLWFVLKYLEDIRTHASKFVIKFNMKYICDLLSL